jgi:predicted Zn-dependent protease
MRRSVRGAAEVALSLPFDRGQESEADIVGLDYMARAGFDPRSSIYLWKNMAELNAGQRMPEFLSTHPSGDRRMGDLIGAMTPALITSAEAKEQGRYANCVP